MSILNNFIFKSGALILMGMVLLFGNINCIFAQDLDVVMPEAHELQGGWYSLDPYQYEKEENGIKTLHGLDFELTNSISKEVGENVSYEHIYWDILQQDIKDGKKDFAMGAFYTEERAAYAYYSTPYRDEEDSLFVPRNILKNLNFKTNAELLNYLKQKKFRLAVGSGYIYADPLINAYIADPANKDIIIKTNNDYQSLNLLIEHKIDGFLSDRIVGATMIWRLDVGRDISEHRLQGKHPVYILFSKKTVSPELVSKYNAAISRLNSSDKYQKIVAWYLYPILFLQTEDAGWFRFTEVLGTIAFAISGLIIAFKEKTTLFGALILAILPSLGGGLMRDVIFGRNPVGALQSPIYLMCVLFTVIIGFIIIKLLTHFRRRYHISGEIEDDIRHEAGAILVITDAIGLAMFSVTGVIVSLSAKVDPLWLWGPFFAFLIGAGGGILRDMISKTLYIAALEGELYGEIAILWGFFLSVFITVSARYAESEYIQYAVIITICGAFITRLMVHFLHIPNARFGKEV